MNRLITAVGASIALAILTACGDTRTLNPKSADPALVGGAELAYARGPEVRISEFHYDNGTTDVDEKVEISGPAGTSLDGWSLVLYNGNPSARTPYSTTSLNGLTIPATPGCGTRGVVVITPSGGIQDASSSRTLLTDPDGIALVNGTTVVDVIGYEGSFVAAGGVAVDRTFPNIGVREKAIAPEPTTAPVWSLKRSLTEVWSGPSLNDFGTCNDNTPPAPQVVDHLTLTPNATSAKVGETQQYTATAFDASNGLVDDATFSWQSSDPLTASVNASGLVTPFQVGDITVTATTPNGVSATATLHIEAAGLPDIRFSEVHYDFPSDNQAVEIEAPGGTDFSGWGIAFYDGDLRKMYLFRDITGLVDADTCGRAFLYAFVGTLMQKGSPDGMALIKPADTDHPYPQVVEFLSYEGTFTAADGPAEGKRSVDIGKAELRNLGGSGNSIQRERDGTGWFGPGPNTFAGCNNDPPPPPLNVIEFSGRGPTDPSLPVGFEDQLFAVERDAGTNAVIPTTFMWTTETPSIATIDGRGVIHAWQVGTATVRATAADGASATWSLSIANPLPSGSAVWGGNLEFGQPIGPNDLVVTRAQYTASFNQSRRIANWVSAKLEASHFGLAEDLCDCFTYDPQLGLPMNVQYNTADYPAPSGVLAAFERGHLLRSADLTVSDGDNKFAYLFTNVVPMSHELRVGAWASMESYLGGLARTGKDVFMIAGSAGSSGTVRNEGRVTIPSSLWKVAVIMSHGQGLADVHSAADVQVVAAIMPNDASVGSDWLSYKTTVDAVEALSGFDLLSLLEDQIEIEVESGSRRAIAALDGPYTALEGGTVAMSAAGSSDPDGDPLTYQWAFSDGTTATGVSVSHTYPQQGSFSVTLTVTESHGLVSSTTSSVTVSNVAPAIGPFTGATLNVGDTYSATGAFTDPGADTWTATVNYGDGATTPLSLSGNSFSLSHTYSAYGTYTVTVSISDGTATSTRTQTVLVRAYPVAGLNGPYTSAEGASVAMSAAASSDADGSIQSYAWNFGDGTTGTGASVSHTYAQDGSYTVTITVTDNDGLTNVSSAAASVSNVAPTVSAFAGATVVMGEAYTASGSFTDPGADSWSGTVNYGDGPAGALALAGKTFALSHVYNSLGTFTVTVSVSDGAATSTKTAQVRVLARPVASVNGPYSASEGASVAMSAAASIDEDGAIQSYAWDFGDGTTAAGSAVSHTYMRDGSYTVRLTVTDNDGLTDVATTSASVANVAPAIAAFAGGVQLRGETYSTNGSFTDPGDDSWSGTVNYGDGTPPSVLALTGKTFALSHVYPNTGNFTVTVSISDGAVTSTRTNTVAVRARPVAAVNGPYQAPEGTAIPMSGSGSSDPDGTIQSYAWTFGDGTSGTGVNVSHAYAQDGSYTVTLTVTDNDGLTGVATTSVTVGNVAPIVAAFDGGNTFVGDVYSASGSFTDPGSDTWTATVDYGDGSTGPLTLNGQTFTLSHAYAAPGTFTVVVVVSDGRWTGSRSAVVRVRARPIARIVGALTSTEGASIALSGTTSSDADGTVQSYVWNFGDGASASGASVSHTYAQDGAFVVTLTVTDNDGLVGASTTTAQVANVAPAVPPLTDAAILQGETYVVSTAFTDPGADSWTATVNYGDGPTSALALSGKAFTLSHTYTTFGNFTVTVQVRDDDVTTVRSATVSVMSVAQALNYVLEQCDDNAQMQNRIESAIKQYSMGKQSAASVISHLNSFLKELDQAVRAGTMTAAEATSLRALIQRVISALSGGQVPVTPTSAPAPAPAPRTSSVPRVTEPQPRIPVPTAPAPTGPYARERAPRTSPYVGPYPSYVVLPPATVRAILMSLSMWGGM